MSTVYFLLDCFREAITDSTGDHGFPDSKDTFTTLPCVLTDINDTGVMVRAGGLVTPVPEPASMLLFTSGLACLGVALRRRHGLTSDAYPTSEPAHGLVQNTGVRL